jgi:hypothetical protein
MLTQGFRLSEVSVGGNCVCIIYYSLQFCLYVCSLVQPRTVSDDSSLPLLFSWITARNTVSHFHHSLTCSCLIIWSQEARVGGGSGRGGILRRTISATETPKTGSWAVAVIPCAKQGKALENREGKVMGSGVFHGYAALERRSSESSLRRNSDNIIRGAQWVT